MKARDLINTAEEVLATMREGGLLDAYHTGGYMTVLSPRDRPITTPLLVAEIGELASRPEKIKKYGDYSKEKARRLLQNVGADHLSSWQSRNPRRNKWGGAIHTGDLILSFSGLPELVDEALMLAVAVNLRMIGRIHAHKIADISDNDIFRRLIEH